jgi:hypothetical protein
VERAGVRSRPEFVPVAARRPNRGDPLAVIPRKGRAAFCRWAISHHARQASMKLHKRHPVAFAFVASAVMLLVSGGCGRSSMLDGRRNPHVDAASGRDVGIADGSDSAAEGGGRDSGLDVGVVIGSTAIAMAGCSPNDAEAVFILIGVDRASCDSHGSGAFVSVDIWYTSWENLKPGRYSLDASAGAGAVVYVPAAGSERWESATNVVLTIKSIDSRWMLGHCESSFPSGTVSVDFTAQWCGGNPGCG